MGPEQEDEHIVLLVDVSAGSDGTWQINVNDTHRERVFPLAPCKLVIRLWRSSGTGVLRGTVQLLGSESEAPIHTNVQLEALLRDWLTGGSSVAERQQ